MVERLQLSKHERAIASFAWIRDDYSACVTVGSGFFVSVLEVLQILSVSLFEPCRPRLYVNVVHVACAIHEAGNGVE